MNRIIPHSDTSMADQSNGTYSSYFLCKKALQMSIHKIIILLFLLFLLECIPFCYVIGCLLTGGIRDIHCHTCSLCPDTYRVIC